MKEQFINVSSNYRRPVSSLFKEKIERTLVTTNLSSFAGVVNDDFG